MRVAAASKQQGSDPRSDSAASRGPDSGSCCCCRRRRRWHIISAQTSPAVALRAPRRLGQAGRGPGTPLHGGQQARSLGISHTHLIDSNEANPPTFAKEANVRANSPTFAARKCDLIYYH